MKHLHNKRTALILIFLAALAGCSSGQVIDNYAKPVAPGDGVLLVAVDTRVPINNLILKQQDKALSTTEVGSFTKGRSIKFVELPAGTYQWTKVDLGKFGNGFAMVDYYLTMRPSAQKYFTFTVKPGVTSYPGDFVVNAKNPGWDIIFSGREAEILDRIGDKYYLQLVDRDAMLLQTLSPEQQQMINRLGMVYAGPGQDDFPDFYKGLLVQQGGAK